MAFSPLPTNMEQAKAEILSWREMHKEKAAMLRKQAEAIKVLRVTLTNVIEYYELHPDTAGAAQALKDTEEFK